MNILYFIECFKPCKRYERYVAKGYLHEDMTLEGVLASENINEHDKDWLLYRVAMVCGYNSRNMYLVDDEVVCIRPYMDDVEVPLEDFLTFVDERGALPVGVFDV